MKLFCSPVKKMTPELDSARHEMARHLAEMDFLLRSKLEPVHYQAASKRLGELLRSAGVYTNAFEAARRRQAAGRRTVEVPYYLNEKMRDALESASDPVEGWHAALRAVGIE